MHKLIAAISFLAVLECVATTVGGIVNNGFDDGSIVPTSPFDPRLIKPLEALPGWNASTGGTPLDYLLYNTFALDSAWVSIHDSSTPFDLFKPIEGKYSVFIQGPTAFAPQVDAVLSQNVAVPSDSKSLVFASRNLNGLDLSFNGQSLPYFVYPTSENYSYYGADISAFSGTSGEIRFTAGRGEWGLIDNILFSTVVVPEPSVMALSIGSLVFLLSASRRFRARR